MNISEQLVAQIVAKVMEQMGAQPGFERHVDPSGIISIRTQTVKPEPFDTGKPGDKVFLKDVVTLEESPRLGCGVMEMDHSAFDWTLRYDEVDYIIEGALEILIDGRKVVGNAGDMILIPKDSRISFSAPEFARFMYVVFPANWYEQ